jgi:hypothetical protein
MLALRWSSHSAHGLARDNATGTNLPELQSDPVAGRAPRHRDVAPETRLTLPLVWARNQLRRMPSEPHMTDPNELRRLLAEATPGPWEWWTSCSWRRLSQAGGPDGGVLCPMVASDGHPDLSVSEEDRALIVAAVNSLPELLDTLDRLRNENAELREALRPFATKASDWDTCPYCNELHCKKPECEDLGRMSHNDDDCEDMLLRIGDVRRAAALVGRDEG